jgi:Tfp pilus assembly protein FimT
MMFVIVTVSAMALPMTKNMLANARLSGDAHSLSNAVAMAKMRASSSAGQARLAMVTATGTYRVDLKKTSGWVQEGESHTLSSGSSFSYGSVTTPPPNTQGTIGQAPACRDNAGAVITGTSCIVFNSRGLPIDSTQTPTAVDAFYVTDGTTVYGINLGATGTMRLWRTPAHATPNWSMQ